MMPTVNAMSSLKGGVDIPRVIMKPFWRKWG